MELNKIIKEFEKLDESGIKNIRKITKNVKKSIGYFHQDTDGVTSAIGFKNYLEGYGVKTVEVNIIQYGGREFAVPAPRKGYLNGVVDFAHSKQMVDVGLDHHAGEHKGAGKGTSTKFAGTRANIEDIQTSIAFRDIFPPKDLEIIATVDSADFYSHGLTPDDIMRAAFNLNKDISVKDNHGRMGLVVNKLLLSYKNKKGFLEELVMQSKPSLISMYNIIRKLAKKEGYRPPEEIQQHQQNYVAQQKENIVQLKSAKDVETLGSGQSGMLGDIVVQYGGGQMFPKKGLQYDRYVVFKNHPDANFLVIGWPLGLVQASANPFKQKPSGVNLIDIVLGKVISKYKSEGNNKMENLEYIKRKFEEDVTKKNLSNAVGFTFDDIVNTFTKDMIHYENVDKPKAGEMVQKSANIKYKDLTQTQKNILKNVKISLWDLVMSQSGGHPGIVNLTNLNFMGKGYTDKMKKIMADIAKELNKI